MTNTRDRVKAEPVSVSPHGHRAFALAAGIAALASVVIAEVAAAPAAGDSWTYRVVNGYSKEVRGRVQYRIEKVEPDRVYVRVTPDDPALGGEHTEVYTPDGNWLRHPLINHGQPVEYEFVQPYPAYMFPLDPGKSWSVRVNANRTGNGRRASVRVDGEVLGSERITVPAGAFDTIKVRRRSYTGDWDGPRAETNITETDWYAPALGRVVRKDSNSGYMDADRCSNELGACVPVRGEWHIFELVEGGAPSRQ